MAFDDFKKGYQSRTNVVKDEKGDLVADSHSILATWRNCFFQLLNVHGVNVLGILKYIQQSHWCLSPVPLSLKWQKLKRHKSPGIDQIPAELIKAGGRTIRSEVHKLINSI
jgi:hypothetical protein